MRIAIIGKFPPIQGGVSVRTYWTAHALAAAGHDVHVITNAREAQWPFRVHMRRQDGTRCGGAYANGAVTVHWSDPADASQHTIPMASPFVSKLAGIAARVHAGGAFDVIYSHYLEPYGVSAHLAAQMTGCPHVVRMAGSDAGRLWHHPQLEALYDHVLRSAEAVIAAGAVAERARQRGVVPERIVADGGFNVPDTLFAPTGARLDLAALRREIDAVPELRPLMWGGFAGGRPYFGVYGKLGDSKGSFALLAAMRRLKDNGVNVGLVALAHGHPTVEKRFRARARNLGLADRVLQLPFLPHWRVPALLRGALAVCCLEQDFAIRFHTPIIPREVLLCGTCLVASAEVIRKLPDHARLPHRYGCMALEDATDVGALSEILAAIAADPKTARAVGARGRAFALALQRDIPFPQRLETLLADAAARRTLAAREIRDAAMRASRDGAPDPASDASAVGIARKVAKRVPDPLFRLRAPNWALRPNDLARLVPVRDPRLRVMPFNHDLDEREADHRLRKSRLVVLADHREPLVIDEGSARMLELSDGTRTAAEIVRAVTGGRPAKPSLAAMEALFAHGLVSLRQKRARARRRRREKLEPHGRIASA